jgi:predicted nucleic acid-binding protein
MRRRVLDTSVLINFWRKEGVGEGSTREAGACADRLAAAFQTNAILTPVLVEFVAGARNARELTLMHAFLARFHAVDEGNVLARDWVEARRLAEWVPPDGRPRHLGDCLIKAIAKRLNYEVETRDKRFSA